MMRIVHILSEIGLRRQKSVTSYLHGFSDEDQTIVLNVIWNKQPKNNVWTPRRVSLAVKLMPLRTLDHWCLYRHLCILPERFGKKRPMNRKFDHCEWLIL